MNGIAKLPKIRPRFIVENGARKYAMIPYDKYVRLADFLEDLEDVIDIVRAKKANGDKKAYPISRVRSELGL